MVRYNPCEGRNAPVVDRRSFLQSTGSALAAGTALAGFSSSAAAASCPDPNNGESYIDCWDGSDTWDEMNGTNHNPDGDRFQADIRTAIGNKGISAASCNDCVVYEFDIVASCEARKKWENKSNDPNMWNFGFRWNGTGGVVGDPQPQNSQNTMSGESDPDGYATPSGDNEDAVLALADVAVSAGTLVFSGYGPHALLYTVARTADFYMDDGVESNSVYFGTGDNEKHKAGNFAMYNMRFQVPQDQCASVEIETFVQATHEHALTSKQFNLDQHVFGSCY